MDLVTSTKALNKTVEASQLTSDLGGSFSYSHADWLQFHQVPLFPSVVARERREDVFILDSLLNCLEFLYACKFSGHRKMIERKARGKLVVPAGGRSCASDFCGPAPFVFTPARS